MLYVLCSFVDEAPWLLAAIVLAAVIQINIIATSGDE